MAVRGYQDLEVWQKAIRLAVESYGVAKRFPADERFGLTSQVRRAAVSVAANIAEGYERRGTREFLKHLSIARGSLAELETELTLAGILNYATKDQLAPVLQLADEVSRMLARLRQSLNRRIESRSPEARAPRPAPR